MKADGAGRSDTDAIALAHLGRPRWFTVLATLGSQSFALATAFAAQLVAVRGLPPSRYGAFLFYFTVILLASTFAQFGFSRVGVRIISEASFRSMESARIEAMRIVSCVATLAVLCSAIVLLLLGPGHSLLPHPFQLDTISTIFVAITCAFEALRITYAELLRGFHRIGAYALVGNALRGTLFLSLLVIWAVIPSYSLDLRSALMLQAASSFICAIIGGVTYDRLVGFHRVPAHLLSQWRIARHGAPVLVIDLSALILAQGDLAVVSLLVSSSDAAIYGACLRICLLLGIPLVVSGYVSSATIARLYHMGQMRNLRALLYRAALFVTLPVLAAEVFLLLFGRDVLRIAFGPYYAQGGSLVAILGLGVVANGITGLCGILLIMVGRDRVVAEVYVLVAGLVITSQVVFSSHGLILIASMSSLGAAASNAVLAFVCIRKLDLNTSLFIRRKALL